MLAAMPAAEAIPLVLPQQHRHGHRGADRAADGRRVQTALEEHRVAQLLVVAGRGISRTASSSNDPTNQRVVISKSRDTPIHRS